MFWSAGCSLFGAEGFSCSLCVLYRGQGTTKLQFFIKKIQIFLSALNFSQFLVIKNLDLDPEPHPDPQSPMRIRNTAWKKKKKSKERKTNLKKGGLKLTRQNRSGPSWWHTGGPWSGGTLVGSPGPWTLWPGISCSARSCPRWPGPAAAPGSRVAATCKNSFLCCSGAELSVTVAPVRNYPLLLLRCGTFCYCCSGAQHSVTVAPVRNFLLLLLRCRTFCICCSGAQSFCIAQVRTCYGPRPYRYFKSVSCAAKGNKWEFFFARCGIFFSLCDIITGKENATVPTNDSRTVQDHTKNHCFL